MTKPLISVVLGTYNRLAFLKLTVASIRDEVKGMLHEIIIVDGGSTDGTMQWLCEQKDIITIVQHNRGEWLGKQIERRSWGYFMNLAFKIAQGDYVCMVSDDCILIPNALKNGYEHAEKLRNQGCKIGAIAFYWREWPKEELYHVGYTLGDNMYVNHGLYLNQALKDVGYIDEDTFFFYHADGDLCLKLCEAGYEVVDSPDSYVEHYPFANVQVRKTNYKKFNQDLKKYLKKWEGIFYNPAQNNCGKIIKKKFYDSSQTVKKFYNQHKKIIQKTPQLMKGKSLLTKAKEQLYWKYKAGIRKINNYVFQRK